MDGLLLVFSPNSPSCHLLGLIQSIVQRQVDLPQAHLTIAFCVKIPPPRDAAEAAAVEHIQDVKDQFPLPFE